MKFKYLGEHRTETAGIIADKGDVISENRPEKIEELKKAILFEPIEEKKVITKDKGVK
jgi:hypothetical protein